MYVCNCNGVSEGRVKAAIRAGARCAQSVHRACGTQPQCGRCLDEIDWMIDEVDASAKHSQSQIVSMA